MCREMSEFKRNFLEAEKCRDLFFNKKSNNISKHKEEFLENEKESLQSIYTAIERKESKRQRKENNELQPEEIIEELKKNNPKKWYIKVHGLERKTSKKKKRKQGKRYT